MHVSGKGKNIKELDLSKVFTTPEAQSSLALVRSLDLSFNKLSCVDSLHPLQSLTTLDLSNNRITTLANLPPTLQRLSLQHNHLSSKALSAVALLPCLEVLDVSYNSKISSLEALQQYPMPSLQVLLADGNGISRLCARASSSSPSSLNTSTVSASSLGGGIAASPSTSSSVFINMPSLRMLSLANNHIADLGDVSKGLRVLPLLEALTLEGCPITQLNAYRTAIIRGLRGLTTLDGTAVVRGDDDDNADSDDDYEDGEGEGVQRRSLALNQQQATEKKRSMSSSASSALRSDQNAFGNKALQQSLKSAATQKTAQQIASAALRLQAASTIGGGVGTMRQASKQQEHHHQAKEAPRRPTRHVDPLDVNNVDEGVGADANSNGGDADTLRRELHAQHNTIAKMRKALRDTLQRYQLEADEGTHLRLRVNDLALQLSDARRVISQQLDTIAMLRAERDAAVEALKRANSKMQKQSFELSYALDSSRAQSKAFEEEKERIKVRTLLESQYGIRSDSGSAAVDGGGRVAAPHGPSVTRSHSSGGWPNTQQRSSIGAFIDRSVMNSAGLGLGGSRSSGSSRHAAAQHAAGGGGASRLYSDSTNASSVVGGAYQRASSSNSTATSATTAMMRRMGGAGGGSKATFEGPSSLAAKGSLRGGARRVAAGKDALDTPDLTAASSSAAAGREGSVNSRASVSYTADSSPRTEDTTLYSHDGDGEEGAEHRRRGNHATAQRLDNSLASSQALASQLKSWMLSEIGTTLSNNVSRTE